jgi:hypothetical protein
MRCWLIVLIFILSALAPARADMDDRAFDEAIGQFESARPNLPVRLFGVDLADYRDALTLRRFASSHWGGTMRLEVERGSAAAGSCNRFAAFVRLPPRDGSVLLVLCPQFFTPGADDLRRLTILHELVHVVAGPDECRAMAFAAHIEQAATGAFTPVERYWRSNGCAGSAFTLP